MPPVSYEQPLYNDLYSEYRDQSDGRIATNAPQVPNVYMMCPDAERQPASPAESGSGRVDDWLYTYDDMSTRWEPAWELSLNSTGAFTRLYRTIIELHCFVVFYIP